MKNVATVCMALIFVTGCLESQKAPKLPQPNIKPLDQHLIATHQDWKDAYGDTFNVQVAYNFAVMRNNQLEIAKMISKMHPPVDPNVGTAETRLDAMENFVFAAYAESYFKNDPNRPLMEKVNFPATDVYIPSQGTWNEISRDKLNEIIDWINKQ